MTIFLENPAPIFALGAVLGTLCGLIFLSKRTLPSLFAFLGVMLLTLLMIVCEWWVVTEREAVELALAELLATIEANETTETVALIDPAAKILRTEVELLMPMVKVSDTGASNVSIEVTNSTEPLEATCRFRGKLQGIHSRSGMQVFYFDEVEMHWIKQDEQWLLEGFVAFQKGKPLNAVESLRRNRPSTAGN